MCISSSGIFSFNFCNFTNFLEPVAGREGGNSETTHTKNQITVLYTSSTAEIPLNLKSSEIACHSAIKGCVYICYNLVRMFY